MKGKRRCSIFVLRAAQGWHAAEAGEPRDCSAGSEWLEGFDLWHDSHPTVTRPGAAKPTTTQFEKPTR